MNAREIMVREVITSNPEMSVLALAQLLTQHNISGTPVLRDGALIGIVTEGDLVDRVKRIHLPTVIAILDAVIPVAGERQYEEDLRKMTAVTVEEIMTRDPATVTEETLLVDVATVISERHVTLLPVMREKTMVGIIGKRDVIRGMLAQNGKQ